MLLLLTIGKLIIPKTKNRRARHAPSDIYNEKSRTFARPAIMPCIYRARKIVINTIQREIGDGYNMANLSTSFDTAPPNNCG